MQFETTRISSKGQIVIPQKIREDLKLEDGDTLALVEHDGLLVLRKLKTPFSEKDKQVLDKIKGNSERNYIH